MEFQPSLTHSAWVALCKFSAAWVSAVPFVKWNQHPSTGCRVVANNSKQPELTSSRSCLAAWFGPVS